MIRRSVWSSQAESDLTEIWLRIANDNMPAADRWMDRIKAAVVRVAEFPGMGTQREELGVGLRSLAEGSYVIFYTSNSDELHIARVIHGARDIEAIFRSD